MKDALAARNKTQEALINTYPECLAKMEKKSVIVTLLEKCDDLWNQ